MIIMLHLPHILGLGQGTYYLSFVEAGGGDGSWDQSWFL
jgi:hypothetical protein